MIQADALRTEHRAIITEGSRGAFLMRLLTMRRKIFQICWGRVSSTDVYTCPDLTYFAAVGIYSALRVWPLVVAVVHDPRVVTAHYFGMLLLIVGPPSDDSALYSFVAGEFGAFPCRSFLLGYFRHCCSDRHFTACRLRLLL